MAACELKRNYNTNYGVFYIDNAKDTVSLPTSKKPGGGGVSSSPPCCIGSIARDETGQTYTLNSNDEWVVFTSSGGGGVEVDIATDEEVESMLSDVFD